MATTIQNFFTKAAENQFSRDFLFRVRNITLAGGITFVGDNDLVYAKTAQLPGRNIDSKVVNYFGQEFQVPGRSTYPEAGGYTISFYHDEDCTLRTKFEAASRVVFNNETSIGQYGMPGEESVINLVQVDKQLNDVRNIEDRQLNHDVKLSLYQVHAVTEGTDAQATVSVKIEENDRTTVGQSADTDTLVASANAYLNALNKMLIKREKKSMSQNIEYQKVKGGV